MVDGRGAVSGPLVGLLLDARAEGAAAEGLG